MPWGGAKDVAAHLSHQPKFVTSAAVEVVPSMHVRRLSAVRRLGVAPDLDLTDVQVGTKVWLAVVRVGLAVCGGSQLI